MINLILKLEYDTTYLIFFLLCVDTDLITILFHSTKIKTIYFRFWMNQRMHWY